MSGFVNGFMQSWATLIVAVAIAVPYFVWFCVTAWRGGFDD